MAILDPKKLLPSRTTGSALISQKSISTAKFIPNTSSLVKPKDITPPETEPGDVYSGAIVIQNKVLSIQKLIGNNTYFYKKIQDSNRKESEDNKFQKKEEKLEEKKLKLGPGIKLPSLPKTGFLDAIKRFLFYTFLGYAFNKFGKYIPKILELTTKLTPAISFFENFIGNVLNGVINFVDAGYDAYDKVRAITKSIGGENAEKKFDEFGKQFNTFANLAIIAGMATMGGTDFGRGNKGPKTVLTDKVSKNLKTPIGTRSLPGSFTPKGYVPGDKISQYAPTNKNVFQKVGQQARIIGKKGFGNFAGRVFGRVPIIGGLIDFIVSTVIFKEKPGRAAAKAVGATIGSALGTFIPIPFAGTILGGILGDIVGGALYDTLISKDSIQGRAKGGEVTRGGKKVSRPAARKIRKIKTKPPKVRPQKTIPGKDIGGKDQIKQLFPTTTDPKVRNPLGFLESTSTSLKTVPMIGGLMGASLDLVMGQKPEPSVFNKIGMGFGSLIQSAIDSETNNTLGNIQKEVVALASGGVIPRTLSSDENIGMKIGERIAKTLEAMVNVKVNQTLQALRKEFGKEGFGMEPEFGGEFGGEFDEASMGTGEMELFKRMVYAEAGGEGKVGMALVARAILNRAGLIQSGNVSSGTFNAKSGSINDIIRAPKQFSPMTDGRIKQSLTESQLSQALDAIRLAQNPNQLIKSLKAEGLDDGTISKLVAVTGFRNYAAGAGYDSSQAVNETRYKRHTFNTAGNTSLLVPKGVAIQMGMSSVSSSFMPLGTERGGLSAAKQLAESMGLDMTSGQRGPRYRGDKSLHIPGRAMDFSNGIDTPQQKKFALEMIKRYGSSLAELIYTPLGFGIKNGKRVPLSVWGDKTNAGHYNHVHVAFEKGGKTPGVPTPAIVGEKGPEFVLDTDTTTALEQNFPGFLDSLNKADYKGTLQVLQNYASYHNPSGTTLMMQRVIIEKPIPIQSKGGGFIPLDNSTSSSNPTAVLHKG